MFLKTLEIFSSAQSIQNNKIVSIAREVQALFNASMLLEARKSKFAALTEVILARNYQHYEAAADIKKKHLKLATNL